MIIGESEYLEIMVGYANLLQNITKQNKIKQLPFIEHLCARHCDLQAVVQFNALPPTTPKSQGWYYY